MAIMAKTFEWRKLLSSLDSKERDRRPQGHNVSFNGMSYNLTPVGLSFTDFQKSEVDNHAYNAWIFGDI